MKDFFGWLVEQKGYQNLGRALPSYFELRKRFEAVALSMDERQVSSLDEAGPTPSVEAAVERTGYTLNLAARNLRKRRAGGILALVPGHG